MASKDTNGARKTKALSTRALNGNAARAWELFLQDYTQHEIAAELGVCQQRVSQLLQAGVASQEYRPRDEEMRVRRAQVEAKISYWSAIALDESRPVGVRVAADKRVAWWYDFRARINAEYAPAAMHMTSDGREVSYVIQGIPDDDLHKGLR